MMPIRWRGEKSFLRLLQKKIKKINKKIKIEYINNKKKMAKTRNIIPLDTMSQCTYCL